jgi:NAD(P)H-flavin reductase
MDRSPAASPPPQKPLYLPREATILAVTDLTPNEKLFRLSLRDGSDLDHEPGQFIQLSLLGHGEAPISVASSPTRRGYFELGIRRVGSLTAAMHEKAAGDTVGIRGPFGTPFNVNAMVGKELLFIAGGCGMAPLRSLIQQVADRRDEFGTVTILYGARSPGQLLFKEDLAAWETVTGFACSYTVDYLDEPGCYSGRTGLITALIPPLELDLHRVEAAIVGPPVMYPPVIAALKQKGLVSAQIVVSLERQMRCGVGKCGHCSIEHLYCCQDGPVFRLSDIENLTGIF